jgi:hypothetical protein
MRSGSLALVLAVALGVGGCARPPYVRVDHAGFHADAARGVLFPSLVRAAAQMGYAIYAVDPRSGVFQVYSRLLGRRSRRARRRYGVMRANLIVVQVRGGEVHISAIGRHVAPDGSMHPALAQEIGIFSEALESAAHAILARMTAGGAMPAPPPAYGGLGGYASPSAPTVSGAVAVPGSSGAPPSAAPAPAPSAAPTPSVLAPASAAPTETPSPPAQTISPAQRLGHP